MLVEGNYINCVGNDVKDSLAVLPRDADEDFDSILQSWCGWRKGDALPSRRDLDPVTMPGLLPYITLFDVVDDGDQCRFRVRLVGTEIVEALREDTTGKYLDDLPKTKAIIDRCRRLCESREPYFVADQPVTWVNDNYRTYSTLGLPLAKDGEAVDMILYVMKFR